MGFLYIPYPTVRLDQWGAFDLDGCGPRPCSRGDRAEIRKRFWAQSHDRGAREITDSFPIAAQAAKGPDIVIWAHDKIGEWADAGLIAPVEVSEEFGNKFFPKAWQAALHKERIWGYPIASGDCNSDL